MSNVIYIEDHRPIDQRIQIARRLFRIQNGSFLEQLPKVEELKRDGQESYLFSQEDSELEKLAKLALNTANSMRDDDDNV